MKRKGSFIFGCLVILFWVTPLQAAYVKRYSTIANGGMTYTGNTLGLSKQNNANAPGTAGSIGTFITTNTASRDGTYPFGTTSSFTNNFSAAVLRLPAGSSVLYAELIWGGSYNYGGQNVRANLDNPVFFSTPAGTYQISPSSSTAATLTGSEFYYVRSADVTSYVQASGAGTYATGSVPGTEGISENNANAAGWTLAVVYENTSLPARNMTIFVGAELTSSTVSTTSSVSGFCTPQTGPIDARMMVSAIEGDSDLTGDQMQFGPTVAGLTAVSGPNNPLNNFFCSQINGDTGALDTSGTFGTLNHTPGSNGSGRRQGWDITNIDVSARMQNGQSTAYARGTTSGDRYVINSIGLQINVGAPVFPSTVMSVNKAQTFIGDVLTYTVSLNNTAGTADALNLMFTTALAAGTTFVPGSFTIGGVAQPGANPVTGVTVGTVPAGSTVTITYQAQVNAIPIAPATAQYQASSSWTYQYQSCSGFPLNNGSITTNTVVTTTPRLVPTKSANPSGRVLPGGTVTYTIAIPNTGTANTSGTTMLDPIPTGTTYVPNSTTMNGVSVPDNGGLMPFATARLVNSPGNPAGQIAIGQTATISFQVTINPSPPIIITNLATIDPDGTGPAPPVDVAITNPPVQADLAVAITDGQTTAIPGNPITYTITVTNNGPDTVISLILSASLPAGIVSPSYTPGTGTYNSQTGAWTGFTLASGQSITLTITGTVAASATGTLTTTATVAPSAGVLDPNYANNTASDTDTLTPWADLAITKSDGQTGVLPNNPITYTITVSNLGPSSVRSLTVTDTLPPDLLNPVFTPNQGIYNADTGAWTGLNLGPGQSIILTLTGTVSPTATGTLVNTVFVSPPVGVTDPNPANNNASDINTIGYLLNLSKSVDKSAANPGQVITYTTTYQNTGGGVLQGIHISDVTPPFTKFLSASFSTPLPANLTGCTITSPSVGGTGDILWTFTGALSPGSSGTITFQVTVE